jgi:transcriptional regulator with XRE-family HTH domain
MHRRSQADYLTVTALIGDGLGDSEIARRTGIPRATISGWRHGRGTVFHEKLIQASDAWSPPDARAYCYLLGVYLGDGCLTVLQTGASSLIVSLDSRYPDVIAEVGGAIVATLPTLKVRHLSVRGSQVRVSKASHPVLPFAFPQHGPGPKHLRRIALKSWQRKLTAVHPTSLLRGLIHSDGCRVINRFQTRLPTGRLATYEYPRYFFSNLSADIRRIFCEHCDLLDIRWTGHECGRRDSNPHSLSTTRT